MKYILSILALVALVNVGSFAVTTVSTAKVDIYGGGACTGSAAASDFCQNKDKDKAQVNDLVKNIIDILLYIVGIASVIVIIVSGIKYVTSSGDASKVASAKNTLMYAIVGVVVAAFAYAIVNYIYENVIK